LFANNAPKILLETVTATTAAVILFLTLLLFIVGFTVDFITLYENFENDSRSFYSASHFSNNVWNATITDVTNVLAINFVVNQYNLSSVFSLGPADNKYNILNNTQPYCKTVNTQSTSCTFNIKFNVYVWACYNSDGCGNKKLDGFVDDQTNNNDWQQVLVSENQQQSFTLTNMEKNYFSNPANYVELYLIRIMFQNQESVPSNGLIKSYYLKVEYIDPITPMFVQNSMSITYKFTVITRPVNLVYTGLTVTTSLLLFYYYLIISLIIK
jgi:hypothetical protein